MFFLSCVFYVFVRVCLYVLCGHLLGKGWPLGSRLWCLTVNLSLSHWYPGSGVVLDCIDSWSLHPYLLWLHRFLILAFIPTSFRFRLNSYFTFSKYNSFQFSASSLPMKLAISCLLLFLHLVFVLIIPTTFVVLRCLHSVILIKNSRAGHIYMLPLMHVDLINRT